MSRIPSSYTRAEWRNTTPVDGETETIGLGFNTAGGEVVRLSVSIASAKHIAESLHEFLSSHAVMPRKEKIMKQATPAVPVIFECVYYFDGGCEDFVLAGVFTQLSAAEECKQSIECDTRLRPVAIAQRTLAALQKEFLDSAIGNAKRLTLYSRGFPIATVERPNP